MWDITVTVQCILWCPCLIKCLLFQITSAWQEHCDIEFSKHLNVAIKPQSDVNTYTLHIHKQAQAQEDSPSSSCTTPVLKLTVPEMFNMALRADNATIHMRRKVMGDVSVDCNSGLVCIDQLRGENISLHCNSGTCMCTYTYLPLLLYICVI